MNDDTNSICDDYFIEGKCPYCGNFGRVYNGKIKHPKRITIKHFNRPKLKLSWLECPQSPNQLAKAALDSSE